MAAIDEDASYIGTHRMIYASNVPHYWVERPEARMYYAEQMIHSVTARPGQRYVIGRDRREIHDSGPFDIHYMITKQPHGWTRETVVFRSGDPSPYPVEVMSEIAPEMTLATYFGNIPRKTIPSPHDDIVYEEDDETIRKIAIYPSGNPYTQSSYWDEINDMCDEDTEDEYPSRIRINFAEEA